jgi:hypothetical protein
VGLEQPPQRLAQWPHHLAVVWLFEVGRCEAARQEQSISLDDRQIEMLSKVDEQLAAWLGAAGLHEAEVLGGDVGVERQFELGQAALGPPEADQLTGRLRLPLGLDDHPSEGSAASNPAPLPAM